MGKDNLAYLRLMVEAAQKIDAYLAGMSRDDFLRDGKTQSAILMQLQVIGELSKKVPDDMKTNIFVPWKDIAGLRDMVSHDYFSLDIEAIWNTATVDVVELREKLGRYLTNPNIPAEGDTGKL
jgi:uncharacterized protein with HEPN domain